MDTKAVRKPDHEKRSSRKFQQASSSAGSTNSGEGRASQSGQFVRHRSGACQISRRPWIGCQQRAACHCGIGDRRGRGDPPGSVCHGRKRGRRRSRLKSFGGVGSARLFQVKSTTETTGCGRRRARLGKRNPHSSLDLQYEAGTSSGAQRSGDLPSSPPFGHLYIRLLSIFQGPSARKTFVVACKKCRRYSLGWLPRFACRTSPDPP